jgi:orotidine-5'-phosphate decarboxylase
MPSLAASASALPTEFGPQREPSYMSVPKNLEPRERLIVALDVDTRSQALGLIDQLAGIVSFYKVGFQLFLSADGMKFVDELAERQLRVFLDLKMEDVEETISRAVEQIAKRHVHFLTIHGNGATARAAIAGRGSSEFPKILSVTLLSSLDRQDLIDLQILGKKGKHDGLDQYVLWRAQAAVEAGCDGLIASGTTIGMLRENLGGDPIIVSPGIRPTDTSPDDHKRTTTPREAIRTGADYLVVGRPIRNARNPRGVASSIVGEIEQGLSIGV